MPILKKHAQLARAGGDVYALYADGKKTIGKIRYLRQRFADVRDELVNAAYITEEERSEALAELDGLTDDLASDVKTFANDEL